MGGRTARAALSIVRPNNLPRISILTAALHGAELYALRKRLARAQDRATEMLATLQVSQMPTREDLLAAAKAMFARTPSLDEIADRTFMNSFSHPSAGLLRLRLSIIISWSGRSYLGSSNFRLRERFDPKAPPPKTAAFCDAELADAIDNIGRSLPLSKRAARSRGSPKPASRNGLSSNWRGG